MAVGKFVAVVHPVGVWALGSRSGPLARRWLAAVWRSAGADGYGAVIVLVSAYS